MQLHVTPCSAGPVLRVYVLTTRTVVAGVYPQSAATPTWALTAVAVSFIKDGCHGQGQFPTGKWGS